MSLGTFIAGRYSGAYNAVDVGVTRQGYELEFTSKQEVIDETDAYGQTTIDWILRGADCFMQFISREYKAGSLGAFFPGNLPIGQLLTAAAPIGRLASAVAQAMVLTSTTGTPAATTPATLTASTALLAPGYNGRILFDSRLREVPVRLQFLPYPGSPTTTLIWFSTT